VIRTALFAAAIVGLSSYARADEYEPPRSAPPAYAGDPLPKPPPLGRHGFQMALRTGYAIPMGSLHELVSGQVPVLVDLGGKPDRHLFIGGFVGFGFGGTEGALARTCGDCGAGTFQIGAQIHYAILPDAWVNPWFGYGLGFSELNASDGPSALRLRSFDIAHLFAGVDFRLSRSFGLGPFLDFDLATYSTRHVEGPPGTFTDAEVSSRRLHEWLTIGPRFVFFP
jgi:hypothetical protein